MDGHIDRRIMLNEDETHFLHTRALLPSLGEEEIRSFIRQYEGTQLSDMILSCGGRMANFPSKILDSWLDKYDQTEENGRKVNYKNNPVVSCAERIFRRSGLDFIAICIDELRKIGIRPWLSIRMNDCHDNDLPTSFLHPRVFHEHPEYRRVQHRAPIQYYDRCFDYARPEVRRLRLDFIEEAAMRYDADGIELDWQREIFCFAIGQEWEGIALITSFMQEIRAVLDEAEKKWGHPIQLGVRTLSSPGAALDCGFDVMTWAREGLIDVLVPCPRWETTDFDIPVELWKRVLSGTFVKLAIGIETQLKSTPCNSAYIMMPEYVHALAVQYLSMGADSIYLFNYMDFPTQGNILAQPADDSFKQLKLQLKLRYQENYYKLLRTIGSLDTALQAERRHVVTFTDIGPVWFNKDKNAALPITVGAAPQFLRLRVGSIPADAKVEIRIAGSGIGSMLLFANSKACTFLRTETVVPKYTNHEAMVFAMENDGRLPPFLVLEMRVPEGEIVVDYAEAHVMPAG
jgi:hypothetical protein